MAVNAYYGVSITLADTNAHNLYDLLVAIEPELAGLVQNVQSLRIQADDSNSSNAVYIGDAAVASTRMSYNLLVHDQNVYTSPVAIQIPLKAMYVRAAGATCILHVEILP